MCSNKLSNKLSLNDILNEIEGKRVLVRVDFNVPLKGSQVTDSTRIKATIPTLKGILAQKPKYVAIISHCGRPNGQKKLEYSLKPCAKILEQLLGHPVTFVEDCVGPLVSEACNKSPQGSVLLLENLRFHVEEEGKGEDSTGKSVKATPENKEKFCNELTSLGDIFINDAFGTAHRAHASMVGVKLAHKASGYLLQKELEYFSKVLEDPARPFLAILGGAKVQDKILLIENLLNKVDRMIIGGGMAYTFKKVIMGMDIGNSLYDSVGAEKVKEIMQKAKNQNVEVLLPVDFVVADAFSESANTKIVNETEGIHSPWQGLDIGPESIVASKKLILSSKTICWNGPQGRFEWPKFATGSLELLDAVVEATKNGCVSIVGGGDTASLVENAGKSQFLSHISTGGGASLELLEGKILPGVQALSNKNL
jgi:phosphoglycerate kinase